MSAHKKSAAVAQHRDAGANTLIYILTRLPHIVKLLACGMGWLLALLAAMMAYGSAVEGLACWWAALLASVGCVALACWLYRIAEGEARK